MNAELLKSLYAQFVEYDAWLNKQALSMHTKRAYKSRLNHFLVFLATSNLDYSKVLTDARARSQAVTNYREYLLEDLGSSPTSINTTLSSIDHFYKFLGLEATGVIREEKRRGSPRALTGEEQARLLWTVERLAAKKHRALGLILIHTGIQLGECAALNVEDISLQSGQPSITINSNRKNRSRCIALNESTATALREWLTERAATFRKNSDRAVFLNPRGKRITTAGLDLIIRKIGQSARLDLSAQVIRHTCLMTLLLKGNDVRRVARISGHKRLETTRRYCLPTITLLEETVPAAASE